MKNPLFTLLFMLTVVLTSCSSSDNNSNNTGSNFTFSAKIDGVDFKPDCITALNSTATNTVLVTGSNCTTGEVIQLFFPIETTTVGTFTDVGNPLVSPFIQAYYAPTGDGDASDAGYFDVGDVTITTFDKDKKQITGSFSFTTKDFIITEGGSSGMSWNVSEGSFSVTYSDI